MRGQDTRTEGEPGEGRSDGQQREELTIRLQETKQGDGRVYLRGEWLPRLGKRR